MLWEIQQDETMEIAKTKSKGQIINHKEYITWWEFLDYFDNYKSFEDRN